MPASVSPLHVLRDLMQGGKHSRVTVRRFGVSSATADRWLVLLEAMVPGVKRTKVGKTSWFEWSAPAHARGDKKRLP